MLWQNLQLLILPCFFLFSVNVLFFFSCLFCSVYSTLPSSCLSVASIYTCRLHSFLWLWHLPVNLPSFLQVSLCTWIEHASVLHGFTCWMRCSYFSAWVLNNLWASFFPYEKSELSIMLLFFPSVVVLLLHRWLMSLSLGWLKSVAGFRWKKGVSCGDLGVSPPLSLGSCQAKEFPLSDWIQGTAHS